MATNLDLEALREIRRRGGESLYYFQKATLGDVDLSPELHGKLCLFYERPSRRKAIFAFRGSFKSSTLRAWIWWMGLYEKVPDFSSLMVGQKYELIKGAHEKLQNKARFGAHADLLVELFSNPDIGPVRLPPGAPATGGWTTDHTKLLIRDANASPLCTIGSLDGRLESVHVHAVLGDDLEGADAEVSAAPNKESFRFVADRAKFLLLPPERKPWIIINGTPHGPNPLSHRMRALAVREFSMESTIEELLRPPEDDQEWEIFWQPVMRPNGEGAFPKMGYTREWWEQQLRESSRDLTGTIRKGLDTQYLLLRGKSSQLGLDVGKVQEGMYEWSSGGEGVYFNAPTWSLEHRDERTGDPIPRTQRHAVHLRDCRIWMHLDPAHKDPEHRKAKTGSFWSLQVTATTVNMDVIVLYSVIAEMNLARYLSLFFSAYCRYVPEKISLDPVGAQSWIIDHVHTLERTRYAGMRSLPTAWRPEVDMIPAPSRRFVEVPQLSTVDKFGHIQQQMEAIINPGHFHMHRSQRELLAEIDNFGDEDGSYDGLDALSQGPRIWKPAIPRELLDRAVHYELERQARASAITGYIPPA